MVPSQILDLYEELTWFDLQYKVQLRFQLDQTKVLQEYQNLALILSAAFGGGEKGGERDEHGNLVRPDAHGGPYVPKNADELKGALRGLLSGGGNG
jgi:hypothetical protein